MILNTVTSLRPFRLISNLRSLKSNFSKTPFKKYCTSHSIPPNSNKPQPHNEPEDANKLIVKLVSKQVSSKAHQGFYEAFPKFVKDIVELPEFRLVPAVKERLEQIILFNSPFDYQFCGIQVVAVSEFYDRLRDRTTHDENNLQKIYTLGWCTELIISAFAIKDDFEDGATIRRGKTCWHTVQEPNAPRFLPLNDAFLLEQAAFAFVESTFEHHPAQQKLSQVFRQALAFLTSSYSMEYIMNSKFLTTGKIPSMNDYCWMRKVQNGYSLFIFPIASGAVLNGITDPFHLDQLTTVCLELALYFAIMRDYMDSFKDAKQLGNEGTDIQNARITWILITAFEKASPAQRKQIQENIGKSAVSNVRAVRDVFQELDIPKLYSNYRKHSYEEITKKITNMPETLPKEFLQKELDIFAHFSSLC